MRSGGRFVNTIFKIALDPDFGGTDVENFIPRLQATQLMWHTVVLAQYLLCAVMSLQRFPTDRAYFIAKELLTTERTYLKDLEVVTVVRVAC